jgi:Fic family protein
MQTLTDKYFNIYQKKIGKQIQKSLSAFDFSDDTEKFSYLTKSSAVYSSNIEGNTIDLNSFMNHEMIKGKAQKEIQEIENLISAYNFAQKNSLNEQNFLKAHKIFSPTLVSASNQGKYRTAKIGVFSKDGLVYLAVEPEFVKETMQFFFEFIEKLLNSNLSLLSIEKIFYYASFLHLRFAHIHPFFDGNGRAGRLLEKWFIAEKLGQKFWTLPTEKYYKENQKEYYKNINLGVNFYELNYDNCLNFLTMLPASIKN